MDRETYRKAFDGLSFSDDFQARTEALLRDRARDMEKERNMTKFGATKKTVLLAAAFDSEDAVAINETAAVGDYTVTLAGLVSGGDLSAVPTEYNGELISDRTYAVFTLTRTDGQPLEEQPEGLAYSTGSGSRKSFQKGSVPMLFRTECNPYVPDGRYRVYGTARRKRRERKAAGSF